MKQKLYSKKNRKNPCPYKFYETSKILSSIQMEDCQPHIGTNGPLHVGVEHARHVRYEAVSCDAMLAF